MRAMKDKAILATSATSTTKFRWPRWSVPGQKDQHQAAGRPVDLPDTGRSIIVLSEGRLLNLGNATGPRRS
ncbi:S-adenosyl-L-homocysteine hydrolase, NAD binding domain protein [Mycobacterium xenopi 3993]|nr:S-adenosyl-L-homocysteine hydrolase, NAD binding domain protein [Mycobacterium xenopi 3993]